MRARKNKNSKQEASKVEATQEWRGRACIRDTSSERYQYFLSREPELRKKYGMDRPIDAESF